MNCKSIKLLLAMAMLAHTSAFAVAHSDLISSQPDGDSLILPATLEQRVGVGEKGALKPLLSSGRAEDRKDGRRVSESDDGTFSKQVSLVSEVKSWMQKWKAIITRRWQVSAMAGFAILLISVLVLKSRSSRGVPKKTVGITLLAILALFLTVGFYGLALGIAGILLFIPYAEIRYAQRLDIRVAGFCLAGALAILAGIVPRRQRFEEPGQPLEVKQHGKFLKEVKNIAEKTRQKMPSEVYVIPEMNAFVTERGGFMGIGSRRVMGVGLPLLIALTVSEFRAILAHEFGHFCRGDTKLGRWIYKIRMAIIRTLHGLRKNALIQLPFFLYSRIFLLITHLVSRHQEFVADRIAASLAGKKSLMRGLRNLHGADFLFQSYWESYVQPVLNTGRRPPITEGFSKFLKYPPIAEVMDKIIQQQMDTPPRKLYDTHPSLRDRLAAIEALPSLSEEKDDTPAISLLEHINRVEGELLEYITGAAAHRTKRIEWQDVGAKIFVRSYTSAVLKYASCLKGVTPANIPEFLKSPGPLVQKIIKYARNPLREEELGRAIIKILGQVLSIALVEKGWVLVVIPGEPVELTFEELVIHPFGVIQKLALGEMSGEEWRGLCEKTSIADVDFGTLLEEKGPASWLPGRLFEYGKGNGKRVGHK